MAESMTIRSPRRAGLARVDERLAGVAERADVLGAPALVAFLIFAFFAVACLAVALTRAFLAAVLFERVLSALVVLTVVFFAGTGRLLS